MGKSFRAGFIVSYTTHMDVMDFERAAYTGSPDPTNPGLVLWVLAATVASTDFAPYQ